MKWMSITAAGLIVFLSWAVEAKPRTYDWVYRVVIVSTDNGELLKWLQTLITKKECEAAASVHRQWVSGTGGEKIVRLRNHAQRRVKSCADTGKFVNVMDVTSDCSAAGDTKNKTKYDDLKRDFSRLNVMLDELRAKYKWVCVRMQPIYLGPGQTTGLSEDFLK